MPQLEVGTYASQIFWLIITFSVLYYLLSQKALPRIAEILEARQDRIAADLDQAQRLRAEAEETLAGYEERMAKARDRAHQLLSENQARLQADAEQRIAELDQRLTRQLAEAEARIGEAKQKALAELEDVALSAAQAAVERLVGITVGKQTARAALREVRPEAA